MLSVLRFTDSDYPIAGADPEFQVRGAHLQKSRRAEGGAKMLGIFRVKNHDFTQKNHIFSNFRGRAPGAPPGSAPALVSSNSSCSFTNIFFVDFVSELSLLILCILCSSYV